jgi:hypothetical protein
MKADPERAGQIDAGDMCARCMELLGAGIYIQPHSGLALRQSAGDERQYSCQTCGCHWIHEGGSSGAGWIRPLEV